MPSIEHMTKKLREYGFIVGDRDPRLNTDHPGRFMVSEPADGKAVPTKDGSNGPWCIVGDNLDDLVIEAYAAWEPELTGAM